MKNIDLKIIPISDKYYGNIVQTFTPSQNNTCAENYKSMEVINRDPMFKWRKLE